MEIAAIPEARLEQRLSPRLIQFYEMLQCSQTDLERMVAQELASNPALELVEPAQEASSQDIWDGGLGPPSGLGAGPLALSDNGWQADGESSNRGPGLDEADDPMAALPAPVSLQEHLRWHLYTLTRTDEEQRIGERLVAEISDEGYYEGSLGEAAMALGASVLEVERVLGIVQRLDPLGVGARDLRECLQIQLRALREQGREHTVAWRITEECWEPFCRRQYALCARRLKVAEAAIADAAEFVRDHCHPYPGRQFRLPWQAPSVVPRAWPEVRIVPIEDALLAYRAEVIESRRLTLRIDRIYRRLYYDIRRAGEPQTEEAVHVAVCVKRARQFIRNLQQRRETLRRVSQEVANEQRDFLRYGPDYLKPLTRIAIARRLQIHESTVGRAVSGKWVQLPSGDVAGFEVFFDASTPVRRALTRLIDAEDKSRPLSDQVLTRMLTNLGYDIARRTVAKYRQELHLPPASQRRRRT